MQFYPNYLTTMTTHIAPSHQYVLVDEGVTEEIKRQTFSKHYFSPHRHKVLMRALFDQFVRDSTVGLIACTRRGDVVVYLDNFPVCLTHVS